MKIKKTFQGTVPENKILNAHSNSQTDVYSCDYINKSNTYSTEEQKIGIWIDGKPIYRKVIEVDISTFTTETTHLYYDLSMIDTTVNIRAITERKYNIVEAIPRTANATNLGNWFGVVQVDKGNGRIAVELGAELRDRINNGFYFYIIFEYTKTTD